MTLLVNDRVLLDAFRSGEEWALRQVYREYAPKVARYAKWNFEMSYVDVSETTQMTFIRVFRIEARQSYDGIRPFLSFVLRTAHNVAVNELKKAWRRRESLPDDPDGACLESLAPNLEEETEARAFAAERQRLLAQLTRSLCAVDEAVFEKRFVEEMSQEATAEALGLSRQRVRTIERNIRRSAFKIFKNSGHLPAHVSAAVVMALVGALLQEVAR